MPSGEIIGVTNQQKSKPERMTLIFLATLAVILSGRLMILLAFIFSFFPVSSNIEFFRGYRVSLHPNRQLFLYHMFVIMGIIFFISGLKFFSQKFKKGDFEYGIKRFLISEILWFGLTLFAIFKMVAYGYKPCARYFFYTVIVLSSLSLVFWPKLDQRIKQLWSLVNHPSYTQIFVRISDGIIPLIIFLLIFIPTREGALALIFKQDHFRNFDTFVASAAWAVYKGSMLYVDQYSQYGFGLPVFVAGINRIMGGFTYENILLIFTLCAAVYLISSYVLLRLWLKNLTLAILGILLILKFQMFNNAQAHPIIWRLPSSSVVKFIFDIPFFI